jgi:hypothetical protein
MIWDVHSGSGGQKSIGSRIRISNTVFFLIVMDPLGLSREGAEAYWNSLQAGHTGLSVFG